MKIWIDKSFDEGEVALFFQSSDKVIYETSICIPENKFISFTKWLHKAYYKNAYERSSEEAGLPFNFTVNYSVLCSIDLDCVPQPNIINMHFFSGPIQMMVSMPLEQLSAFAKFLDYSYWHGAKEKFILND